MSSHTATMPTRAGSAFIGYFTAAVGGTRIIDANGNLITNIAGYTSATGWTRETATTLYAQWTGAFTVTLDRGEGFGGTARIVAASDQPMPQVTPPSRPGYTFQGYFSGPNGTGTQYYNADGSSTRNCDLVGNVTLYAKW